MKVLRGYTTASFGQVHYRYAGTARRPVLVLLHQTPSTSAMYEDLMHALAADFRVFAPDTPGMGQSDPVEGEMTIAALADGIAEFMDELGIDRCHVFGHHTGAAIAAELAARHPDRVELLALSGPTVLDDELRSRLPGIAAAVPPSDDGSHLSAMWQRIRGKDQNASSGIVQRETLSAIAMGDAYPRAYDAVIKHDIESALEKLERPVLMFAGTEDVLYSRLDAAAAIPAQATKEEIPGAKTFVCETHSGDVARILGDFFGQVAT